MAVTIRTTECVFKEIIKAAQDSAKTSDNEIITRLKSCLEGLVGCAHNDVFTKQATYEQLFRDLSHTLYKLGTGPNFHNREDTAFEPDDFNNVAKKAVLIMNIFKFVLEQLSDVELSQEERSNVILRTVCTNALIICAEHSGDHMWTDAASVILSAELLQQMLAVCRCSTVGEILCGSSEWTAGVFTSITRELQPRLSKTSWKQNPTVMAAFQWCLLNIPWPSLSEHISALLAPTLLLLDDHQTEHKLQGLRCLQHILDCASASELSWYGRGEVIYECLQHQLYVHEEALLNQLLPCLLKCLAVLEPRASMAADTETRYDEILERLLRDMEMESQIVIRRTYVNHLSAFLKVMGINLVPHLPALLHVCQNYLECFDGPTEVCRLRTLEILAAIIQQSWPCMARHQADVMKMLVRLVYDVTTERTITPEPVQQQLLTQATECILWLSRATGEQTKLQLQELVDTDLPSDVKSCFRTALLKVTED